jgi:hypothetical protein
MALRSFLTIFCTVFYFSLSSQNDSILADDSFKIREGIYLNYHDFRNNKPIDREQLDSKLSKDHLDYFGKNLSESKFTYFKNGERITTESSTVWGFYQNNTLHVNYEKEFYRVPVFGAICYLMATVEVISPAFYTPGYGAVMGGSVRTREVRNFLINFYDGKIVPFSMERAEKLISRDAELYNEYMKLKARHRKEQVSRYIRKYNELHPVYFLN